MFAKVVVIFTIGYNIEFEKYILSIDKNFIVINVENKGVDIYPFIKCIQYLRKNNIKTDFILKLHTKISDTEWRKGLIKPITDINNLYILQYYFKNMNNIGYIGSQKYAMPKKYDMDFPHNITGINNLCDKFSGLEKDWTDFNGGCMFWINNQVLNQYLTEDLIEYLIPKFINGKPPNNYTNKNIYVEYICERLFTGVFCYTKMNILVNENIGHDRGFDNFWTPQVFSFYSPIEMKYII